MVGAGSWGTALASVLARNEHTIELWARSETQRQSLQQERCNQRYLPAIRLPENIQIVDDLNASVRDAHAVVIAVPMKALRETFTSLHESLSRNSLLCLTCKGLDKQDQSLPHQLAQTLLPDQAISILSGPSFAAEVAKGLPSAVTVASNSSEVAERVASLFHNQYFRTYTNDDMTGVAFAGAVKNVLAIATGISDGLGYGANTRAALITRGLAEISRLGMALGGKLETFVGLAGMGDLVLTCTDDQSRNRRMGLLLAEEKSVDEIQTIIGQAIEGVNTAEQVVKLANRYQQEVPIAEAVLSVIDGSLSAKEAVQSLLTREPRSE